VAARHPRRPVEPLAVLGVDPGTRRTGIVALDGRGRLLFRRQVLLDGDGVPARLLALHRAVDAALERSLAAILAIEDPAHPRNAHVAQLLGRAVGVCQLAAAARGTIVVEYRPAQLRAAVPRVPRRYRSAARWSADEVAAAAAATLAIEEPIEFAGRGNSA